MEKPPQISFIMERVPGSSPVQMALYACRGTGRGCPRNKYRGRKVHCDDCVLGRDSETLAELKARLEKGDA